MDMNSPVQPGNPSEIPVQAQPTQPPVYNQKIFLPIILGAIILLLVVGGGAFYLGTLQNKPVPSNFATYPTLTSTPTLQPTQIPTLTKEVFKTRYFEITSDFWEKDKYPAELTQLEESSLTPISCTSTYSGFGNDYTAYDETTHKSIPLTDTSLQNYIQILSKKYEGKTVNEISSCSSEDGKTIVLYSLGPCGGGCSGKPYVGVVKGSDVSEVASISENMAYFGCRKPLQLTKDNMFYFSCGGGDGPIGSVTIYKLSLSDLSVSRVIYCATGFDVEGKSSYSKCE